MSLLWLKSCHTAPFQPEGKLESYKWLTNNYMVWLLVTLLTSSLIVLLLHWPCTLLWISQAHSHRKAFALAHPSLWTPLLQNIWMAYSFSACQVFLQMPPAQWVRPEHSRTPAVTASQHSQSFLLPSVVLHILSHCLTPYLTCPFIIYYIYCLSSSIPC